MEVLMKKVLLLLSILGVLVAVPILALDQKPVKEPKVYCCHDKSKCDKLHIKAECEKEGGKVVKDCKECK
jgi:hypothetical protein